jgi:hypothetical protein
MVSLGTAFRGLRRRPPTAPSLAPTTSPALSSDCR